MNVFKVAAITAILTLFSITAMADEIGRTELDSGFMSLKTYSLSVKAFDDPEVDGVTCHVSEVEVGGLSLSDDPSASSIACRQTGEIRFNGQSPMNPFGTVSTAKNGELVFSNTKGWTKKLLVRRFVDMKRQVLIYVVYVGKWGEDSKKNVISTISLYSQVKK